jgi:toxin YhaV
VGGKEEPTIEVNGWKIYPHPAIIDQLERLEAEVVKRGDQSEAAKVFKWAVQSIFEDLPRDPTLACYRQGGTLGKEHTGWFRDKYAGRFRLFFRYDLARKEIIPAWVNDSDTQRTRGAKNDAYAVFKRMLDEGNPPTAWAQLREEAKAPTVIERVKAFLDRNRD